MKIDTAKQLIRREIDATGIVLGSASYQILYNQTHGKDISRQTIKNALNDLEEEGFIVKSGYSTPYWRKAQ